MGRVYEIGISGRQETVKLVSPKVEASRFESNVKEVMEMDSVDREQAIQTLKDAARREVIREFILEGDEVAEFDAEFEKWWSKVLSMI